MRTFPRFALTAALILAGAAAASAQEWPRFRGPNGSGVSDATTVPVKWTAKDYNWTLSLPGGGHSSPVIWGEKLFATSADEKKGKRYLLCINTADGSILWRKAFPFSRYRRSKHNSFASNTPAVDADRVYILWQSAAGSSAHALDHDGNPLWEFDMGVYKSGHGTGSSPIVYKDMIVVCNDHDGDSFLIALDRATGKARWKLSRVGDRACYSTPCVYERDGRSPEIIFTHSFRGITGVDAETGKKKWEIDVFGTHKQRAVGSPVLFGDLVIGSSGFTTSEKNVVAVRPGGSPAVKEIYRLQKQVPHVPTPLVYGKRLYLWTDQGIVTCSDAATGERIWQGRVGGTFHSSPVCVGGRLYCADKKGVVSVVATDRFELLGQNDLGEATTATPAVSGGVMYLRTVSRLYSLGGKN